MLEGFVCFCHFACFGNAPFQNFQIGKYQLQIDSFDIANRVDRAVHMYNVGVLKATHNMDNRVHLADVRKELIAQAFALACPAYKPRNVYKFNYSGRRLCGIIHFRKLCKPFVRYGNNAHIRVDGAEGIVSGLGLSQRHRIKQGTFAHVGQTHDS